MILFGATPLFYASLFKFYTASAGYSNSHSTEFGTLTNIFIHVENVLGSSLYS